MQLFCMFDFVRIKLLLIQCQVLWTRPSLHPVDMLGVLHKHVCMLLHEDLVRLAPTESHCDVGNSALQCLYCQCLPVEGFAGFAGYPGYSIADGWC